MLARYTHCKARLNFWLRSRWIPGCPPTNQRISVVFYMLWLDSESVGYWLEVSGCGLFWLLLLWLFNGLPLSLLSLLPHVFVCQLHQVTGFVRLSFTCNAVLSFRSLMSLADANLSAPIKLPAESVR